MTRPAPWRRSTASQRRQQRAEFRELKARIAASPSPARVRARDAWKAWADRDRAQSKVKAALRGEAIRPFSPKEAAKLRPGEHDLLRAEMHNRLGQLTPEERKALTARQHLIFACFNVEQLRATAAGGG